MSRFALVCLSFLAGVLTTLAVLGIGPIFAQTASPSQTPPSPTVPDTDPNGKPRAVWNQFTISDVQGGFVDVLGLRGSIPTFPALNTRPIVKNSYFSREPQILDGLDCRTCTFDNANLVYGGGPFNFEATQFTGQVSIQFVGAAANTIGMLKLTGLLKEPNAPIQQPETDKPVPSTTVVKRQHTAPKVSFGAPYLGKMK